MVQATKNKCTFKIEHLCALLFSVSQDYDTSLLLCHFVSNYHRLMQLGEKLPSHVFSMLHLINILNLCAVYNFRTIFSEMGSFGAGQRSKWGLTSFTRL